MEFQATGAAFFNRGIHEERPENFRSISFKNVRGVFSSCDDIHVDSFVCLFEGFRCPGQKPNVHFFKFSLKKLELLLRM